MRSSARSDAAIDPVTGLFRYDETADGAQAAEVPLAALVVEVENLLIDGDQLLAQAAERVAYVIGDRPAVVRRLSGPQLLVLLAGAEEPEAARYADLLAYAADSGRGGLTVGAVGPRDGGTVQALLRAATVALAHAKRARPGSAALFQPMMADDARDRLAVGRALRVAIARREIALAYQPQVSLVDGTVVGVEVLARWFETARGPIAPDRFVAVAEEIGLAHLLDLLVLEKACEQLRAWDAAGVPVPQLSVNLSAQTLRRGDPAAAVAATLSAYGIAPARIAVEVMGSRVLDEPESRAALVALGALGVRVSLDDFGAGFSSLAQLADLPVDELKIDRSLVRGTGGSGPNPAVLGAITQVGSALGLQVVVVGIETAEHERIARACGCLLGQGYLYARPVGAEELAAWLRQRKPARIPRPRRGSP